MKQATKERPILFSTEMVQAILEGRKTQTRRIVKDKLLQENKNKYHEEDFLLATMKGCPYGKPGDVLWVRETFCSIEQETGGFRYEYKADGYVPLFEVEKFKPSIHMPKAAARIWLEITDVRVERLHQINSMDAVAEGIEVVDRVTPNLTFYRRYSGCAHFPNGTTDYAPYSFQTLWQTINGLDSWNANPWVWVLEFKRIEKP